MKRKDIINNLQQEGDHQNLTSNYDHLDLSLSLASPNPSPPSKPPRDRRTTKSRRSESQGIVKSMTIPPPYPWATDHKAKVHTMHYLLENGLHTISGVVQCKKCEESHTIEYKLIDKFHEIVIFIMKGQNGWHNRGPEEWTSPKLLMCRFCGEKESCKPLVLEKKKNINWLFLLLGQFIGCCTLQQLKYFCKHNNIHRSGAKDRLIYLIYLALCKQLDPQVPF